MKKVSLSLILMFLVSIFVLGCGGEIPSADNLKFKASNVVFRNTVKASDEFTEQKVYADDVVLNNANTSLTADNVQKAFEETQPKLSEIIVGEWDVVGYISKDGGDAKTETGTITFNADGTFSFTEAGQIFASNSYEESVSPIKYYIYDESIINCESLREGVVKRSQIRDFTTITINKLVSKIIDGGGNECVFTFNRKIQ